MNDDFSVSTNIPNVGVVRIHQVDGKLKIMHPIHGEINMSEDGSANLNLDKIKKVSIENIIDVKNYLRLEADNKQIHKIRFENDGLVELIYSNNGKLVDFSISNLITTLSLNNDIIISMPRNEE